MNITNTSSASSEKRYQGFFVEWDDTEEEYLFDRSIFDKDGTVHSGWDTFDEVTAWVAEAKAVYGSIDDIELYDSWVGTESLVFNGVIDDALYFL